MDEEANGLANSLTATWKDCWGKLPGQCEAAEGLARNKEFRSSTVIVWYNTSKLRRFDDFLKNRIPKHRSFDFKNIKMTQF